MRVQGSQIFKRNSIILICSKVIAFLVILLSPHGPCRLHIIPVVPTSSPCHPHGPHKVPMWSSHLPCLWSPLSPPGTMGTTWMLFLSSPHRPCCLQIIPIVSTSPPCDLHTPYGCGLHCLHQGQRGDNGDNMNIVPVIPMSSLSSPHHPHVV